MDIQLPNVPLWLVKYNIHIIITVVIHFHPLIYKKKQKNIGYNNWMQENSFFKLLEGITHILRRCNQMKNEVWKVKLSMYQLNNNFHLFVTVLTSFSASYAYLRFYICGFCICTNIYY